MLGVVDETSVAGDVCVDNCRVSDENKTMIQAGVSGMRNPPPIVIFSFPERNFTESCCLLSLPVFCINYVHIFCTHGQVYSYFGRVSV